MNLLTHPPVTNWQNRITKTFDEHSRPDEGPGIDFDGSDHLVYAAHDGRARLSGFQDTGYGEVIVIEAEGKTHETTYAHLSERLVKRWEYVKAGDVIGIMGSSGTSTGVHLHFGLRVAPWEKTWATRWGYTDPTPHLMKLLGNAPDMCRVGPYVLSHAGHLQERIKLLQPKFAVLHHHEAKLENVNYMREHSPRTKIVARLYKDDSWYRDRILSDPELAAEEVSALMQTHECYGKVDYWITSNEVCTHWHELPFLNRFYLRLQDIVTDRLILFSVSVENVGWSPGAPEGWHASLMAHMKLLYPAMYKGLGRGDLYGDHTYNAPRLLIPDIEQQSGQSYNDLRMFRYEALIWPHLPAGLKALGILHAEFGWDFLLFQGSARRKMGVHDPDAALSTTDAGNQMIAYFAEWDNRFADVPVEGWVFYSGGPGNGWDGYDMTATGGNLQRPLIDEIIDRQIGYVNTDPVPPPIDPDSPPAGETTMKIYDASGHEQSIEWLTANYGQVLAQAAPAGRAFRLVRVDENTDVNPNVKVRVLGADGLPVRAAVTLHWPGAPAYESGSCATQPSNNWNTEWTDGNGYTAFTLGPNVYYTPPDHGFMRIAICDPDIPSDVTYCGMIAGYGYHKLDLVYQIVDGEITPPDPTNPPVDDDIKQAILDLRADIDHIKHYLSLAGAIT